MMASHEAKREEVAAVFERGRSNRDWEEGVAVEGVGALERGVWEAMSLARLVAMMVLRRTAST